MYEEYVGKEMLLEEAARLRGKVSVCGIYSITNKLNGKVYVGLSKSIYNRASEHAKCNTNKYMHNAIVKYGIVNFVHKVEMLCTEAELAVNESIIFDKYKAAGTVMYNIAKCGNTGNKMEYATEEEKNNLSAKISTKLKEYFASMSAEEREACRIKRTAAFANMSCEEIAARIAKIKLTKANRTELEKENTRIKRINTFANRTAEYTLMLNKRQSTIKSARYISVVDSFITLCLQKNIFTFSKYKKYCKHNNMVLQVSKCYFFRLMHFANYKEELYEFVSIYKPDMDYSTYSSLCKLKPINIEVFKVAVTYSTYKYFI